MVLAEGQDPTAQPVTAGQAKVRRTGLRVVLFGSSDEGAGYPRRAALLAALQSFAQVAECPVALPAAGSQRQALAARPWRWPACAWQLVTARRRAVAALRACLVAHAPDLVVVPYPGHFAVRWARAVWRGPLLLDLFLSAYETVVSDRALLRPRSLPARLLRRLDRRAILAADLAVVDTPCHARAIAGLTGVPPARLDWWPVGEARAVVPAPYEPPPAAGRLEVLAFGTGIPLHGLPTLIAAVSRTDAVRLTVIGGSVADREAAARLPAERIVLGPAFVPRDELDRRLAASHLVAGIFGTSSKADAVIPFKLLHALQAGRPVLTADATAVRELLVPGTDCEVVPAGDPAALASALERLQREPQRLAALAAAARAAYERRFAPAPLARRLAEVVARLVAGVDLPAQPKTKTQPASADAPVLEAAR